MATATAQKTRIPGGAYTSSKNDDGTYNIHDVPIFAAHRLRKGMPLEEIDQEWLEKAVQRSQRRLEEDNYLSPLHISHHGDGVKPKRAGMFHLKRVGEIMHEGRKVAAIFADLLFIPESVYSEIKRGGLPYRSVEILNVTKAEIDSLALMDTEVPFFRLPLLTVGKERRTAPQLFHAGEGDVTTATYADDTDGAYACVIKFQEEKPMADNPNDKPEDKKPAEEKAQDMPAGGDKMDTVISMLEKLIEMMTKGTTSEDEEKETPAEQVAAKDKGEDGKGLKASAIDADQLAQISAYKAKVDKLTAERDEDKLVASSLKELTGYAAAKDVEPDLRKIFREGGEEALKTYVASFKKYAAKEPPESFTGELSTKETVSEHAVKFKAEGADVYENAIKYSEEYAMFRRRGALVDTKEEDYIRQNLICDGLIAAGE